MNSADSRREFEELLGDWGDEDEEEGEDEDEERREEARVRRGSREEGELRVNVAAACFRFLVSA